jgi:hypothetical protein
MFNPRWTLQRMVHPMSESKQPKKIYHYGFFSSKGIGYQTYNFLPPHIEVP